MDEKKFSREDIGTKEKPIIISAFSFKLVTFINEEVNKRIENNRTLEAKVLNFSRELNLSLKPEVKEIAKTYDEYFGIVKQTGEEKIPVHTTQETDGSAGANS